MKHRGNPYHDARGRFTSPGGCSGFSVQDVQNEADTRNTKDEEAEALSEQGFRERHAKEIQNGGRIYQDVETNKNGNRYVRHKMFGGKDAATFANAVGRAKESVSEDKRWRVTAHSQEELESDYPGAALHITEGGSTVAVTRDGDIVSVCHNQGDKVRGKEIMHLAVQNGGKKLDSYSGNHGFYCRCGFEPVSWCKWEDEYAPHDWDADRDNREPIIFYQYTGKVTTESADDFMERVPASNDYDSAQRIRDKKIGG